MLNPASIAAVDGASWRGPFIRPLYESYCFSNIPASIHQLLTGVGLHGRSSLPDDCFGELPKSANAVVLFFVDAFGWRFFEPRISRYPALKHFLDNGVVSKLTSQFPSTTAAHVTAIHTGLPPAQSGVYEWYQFEPSLERMVGPLMFSFAGDDTRDGLLATGLQPGDLFPKGTLYTDLKRAGVQSYLFQQRDIVRSAPTRHLSTDATLIGYKTLPEALVNITRILKRREGPAYIFFYWSAIDSMAHEYGPLSDQVEAEIDTFLTALERVFMDRALGSGALLLLTADHGQTEVDPKTTVYLNYALQGFRQVTAQGKTGHVLAPAGSPRDYFLHIKPERLEDTQHAIARLVSGKALVVKTSELIESGLFGPQPSPTFLGRVGNLAVLPFKGESVYYFERDRFGNRFFGHHGGLTRDEMEIPFVACVL